MTSVEVDVRGIDSAIARMSRLKRSIPRSGAEGLRAGAGAIFAASQVEVPKRSGTLAATGKVSPLVEESENVYTIGISYGPVSYARIVHYNNRLRHITGKAYFLIDPMRRFEQFTVDAAAVAVKTETAS